MARSTTVHQLLALSGLLATDWLQTGYKRWMPFRTDPVSFSILRTRSPEQRGRRPRRPRVLGAERGNAQLPGPPAKADLTRRASSSRPLSYSTGNCLGLDGTAGG